MVKEIAWPGRTYLTRRARIAFDKLPAFFGETYAALFHALSERGLPPQGMPAAIYYHVDEKSNNTDLAAAVPVPADMKAVEGFELVHVPQGRALQMELAGPYDGMHAAYATMEAHMKKAGLRPRLMMEEYLNDPGAVADPSEIRTNIIWTVE
ncbi:MAG: GyrI-like domain-containing protein [Flavobacteriales bacterium]|nr:GyrI-like domain-containing protein [Flavobacteriales bacterium]MBP7450972.1 GyrI-like domain-containing protein [Flavobacteriales bacterium]